MIKNIDIKAEKEGNREKKIKKDRKKLYKRERGW